MWIHLFVQSDSRSVSCDFEGVLERRKTTRKKITDGGGGRKSMAVVKREWIYLTIPYQFLISRICLDRNQST